MKRPSQHTASVSLTLATVARRWHGPRRAVRRLLQRGELSFEEVRGQLRVPLGALKDYERCGRPKVRGAAVPDCQTRREG